MASAVAVVITVALLAGGSGGGADPLEELRLFGPAQADPVPYDGRSPAIPERETERVLVELPRPPLGARADAAALSPARQRSYVASLEGEAASLISALEARGVRLRDVVTFTRTFHGFAATIAGEDFTRLQSIGVRIRPNRRFFPAYSQPVPAATVEVPRYDDRVDVTLLAGGVEGARGYDAVDGDEVPDPGEDLREPDRDEVGGAPLHGALEALGARPRLIRVATLVDGEEYATTDTLLAGLERVVDNNGDGAANDHDPVAVVGVSAPYAGFADAPESQAVRNADRLGVTVFAAAGHEGGAAGAYGTIGSPGAAAIAAAPLRPTAALARTRLEIGDISVAGAAVLAGTPAPGELRVVEPVAANTTEALLVAGAPGLQGALAVVEPGVNPGARVAAAAGAGAAAVLLAEPSEDRPLPTLPAGRVDVPVIGVTGPGAEAILEELEEGATATTSDLDVPEPPFEGGEPSRVSSTGPAYDGAAKPDLPRPGTIIVAEGLITGGAVAAARAAVEAARLGDPDQVVPPPDTPPAAPPAMPVPVGELIVDETRRATSVQFTLGTFDRGDPLADGGATTIVPADRLDLVLTPAGDPDPVERLTPPGGQRGLLPGAYAYALPRGVLDELEPGRYVFRLAARAPRQPAPTRAVSVPFAVR